MQTAHPFNYYFKGRVFEWTMAIAMFVAGLELLIWKEVLTFGAFRWLLLVLTQQEIGMIMLMTGWLRACSLIFNGHRIMGLKVGPLLRSMCAVVAATIWAQFSLALLFLSVNQGFPSVGLPFWWCFTAAELFVAYSVGQEWKK